MAKAQTMQQAGALEAKKAENKIMYLQGMQGLQDLANGSVNRAALSGRNIQVWMFVLIQGLMVSTISL